ncbi:Alf1 protein [Starmerella bacillaris]|uniref:Alf1 protein n=1 Tax=Starmerella bacillaris TaxID=1247836 RepID=A0AAV5REG5_STABA|nr:Alf1 protein [Starmerella bacillaris]
MSESHSNMIPVFVKSEYTYGERLVDSSWTFEQFSKKMELVTGIPYQFQNISIKQPGNEAAVAGTPFKDGTLASVNICEDCCIYIADGRPDDEKLNLNEQVDRYEMPDEEYERRGNTLLEWKRRNMLGRFSNDATKANVVSVSDDTAPTVSVGEECFVKISSGEVLRGKVAFIGEVPVVQPGIWVGVDLVTADGKNNGTVRGMKLFETKPNHGILVRSGAVRAIATNEEEL